MAIDETVWSLSAVIKSSVLLRDQDDDIVLQFTDRNTEVRFSVPEAVKDERWSGWQTVMRPTWSYKVTMDFPISDDEDVYDKAHRYLDDLVNLLSFMASAPVQVESYGSIRTPPDIAPGQTYRQIILGAVEGHLGPPVTMTEAGITEQLMPMFGNVVLLEKDKERITRSLRWLQHSYKASTPVDEFLCLMFAIEGIASLLGEGQTLYWRCERCNTQYKECPNCGKSTNRPSSGSALIRDFLKLYTGWSGKRWNTLWSLRSKIAHGDQDLSKSEEVQIINSLPDLEYAVIRAVKFAMKLPDHFSPNNGRFRPLFGVKGMDLIITAGENLENDVQ